MAKEKTNLTSSSAKRGNWRREAWKSMCQWLKWMGIWRGIIPPTRQLIPIHPKQGRAIHPPA